MFSSKICGSIRKSLPLFQHLAESLKTSLTPFINERYDRYFIENDDNENDSPLLDDQLAVTEAIDR